MTAKPKTLRLCIFTRRIFMALSLLLWIALFPPILPSLTFPDDEARGDGAMAERYAVWTKNLIDDGYWAEALAALERAADFADVSSDISYLLALARSHENKPRTAVLEALNLALSVNRWNLYSAEAARLEKANVLIILRAYEDALQELYWVSKSPREASLSLKAFAASRSWDFPRLMRDTLDRYPRETEPVRIFFHLLSNEAAVGRNPEENKAELLELIIRRLPLLLQNDPELAWMAAPFMWDTDEAKRLVLAYRAVNRPRLASIPAALKLGVISEETALEELFSSSAEPLDLALLGSVWDLLRQESMKTAFRRSLSVYTGLISEDSDHDGIPETHARYSEGLLEYAIYDVNQNGMNDLVIHFEAGDPRRAMVLLPPESSAGLRPEASRKQAQLVWERYPAVLEVELDGARYIPRPLDLHFAPVLFVELMGSGVLFPRRDPLAPLLTRRVLVSQALRVERPSLEFSGGIEVVELNQGIPVRAREYVGNLMVSETEFLRGRPQLQRVDLDFDGRMETVRHFRRQYRTVELEELWDFDRDYDYVVSDWDE